MTDKIKTLFHHQIFLASPSDVKGYRDRVSGIVTTLNEGRLALTDHRFDLKTCEDDVFASYGKDPQFCINEQIGNDFDILLVIFGSRIVSKTPRDISGTVEEFNRAVARFDKQGSPTIMLYFCKDLIDHWASDVEQLHLLHQFRRDISDKCFFKEFLGVPEFDETVTKDLSGWMDRRMKNDESPDPVDPVSVDPCPE